MAALSAPTLGASALVGTAGAEAATGAGAGSGVASGIGTGDSAISSTGTVEPTRNGIGARAGSEEAGIGAATAALCLIDGPDDGVLGVDPHEFPKGESGAEEEDGAGAEARAGDGLDAGREAGAALFPDTLRGTDEPDADEPGAAAAVLRNSSSGSNRCA